MENDFQIKNSQLQHIARISHGKDSLKMLDVIVSRGLPLDRITTTDVWATDTIRGEHPEMVKFKEQADEFIWRKYRIEVEHLCAMKDGEKVTYEKMFYHIPKRRGGHSKQGQILGFPTLWGNWCTNGLKVRGLADGFPSSKRELVPKAQAYMGSRSLYGERETGVPSSRRGFPAAPLRGAVQISWNTWVSRRTSRNALDSSTTGNARLW